MIGTMSLLLIVMWGIFVFGVLTENDIFIFLGGCGFLLMTVEIMPNGIEGINNFITRGVAFIHIGIGTIAILHPFLNLDSWGAD